MSEHPYNASEKFGYSQTDNYCHKNKDELKNIQRLNLQAMATLSYYGLLNEIETTSAFWPETDIDTQAVNSGASATRI